MIILPRPSALFHSKFCVIPDEGFHAECTLLSGPSPFLRARARVSVDDGGPDLEVFVNPDELQTRNGRKYVQLCVDPLNTPKQPGEYYLCGLWSAINRNVRDRVPETWIILKKLEDPFPPIKRNKPEL